MIERLVHVFFLTILFWLPAGVLVFVASAAPCGFAPDISCETEGPGSIGRIFAALGPGGVLLIALIAYTILVWLIVRKRKAT